MSENRQSDWRGWWGILWRSLVLMPYMLVIFIGVGIVWLNRWILPVFVALSVYARDWWFAGGGLVLWFVAMWSYRHFRLSRFYESPPSVL